MCIDLVSYYLDNILKMISTSYFRKDQNLKKNNCFFLKGIIVK